MNFIIRYASINHQAIYKDYIDSGKLIYNNDLSDKGIEECLKALRVPISTIYCADSLPSKSTANKLKNVLSISSEPIVLNELSNLKHDFTNYIKSEDELDNDKKMNELRINFINDVIHDRMIEKKSALKKRLQKLIDIMDTQDNSLFITHGIFIVVLKLFIQTNLDLSTKLENLIDFSNPFYSSLSGISFPDLKDFSLIQ